MVSNALCLLALSPLVCNSTLYLNLLYIVSFTDAGGSFFALFVTPKAGLT